MSCRHLRALALRSQGYCQVFACCSEARFHQKKDAQNRDVLESLVF